MLCLFSATALRASAATRRLNHHHGWATLTHKFLILAMRFFEGFIKISVFLIKRFKLWTCILSWSFHISKMDIETGNVASADLDSNIIKFNGQLFFPTFITILSIRSLFHSSSGNTEQYSSVLSGHAFSKGNFALRYARVNNYALCKVDKVRAVYVLCHIWRNATVSQQITELFSGGCLFVGDNWPFHRKRQRVLLRDEGCWTAGAHVNVILSAH